MKTLIIRTLSGAVYVALIVWAILWNDFAFAAVFAVLAALTTYEFHKLTNKQENVNALAWLGAMGSFVLFLCVFVMFLRKYIYENDIDYSENYLFNLYNSIVPIFMIFYICLIISIFITEIFRKKTNPINNIAYTFLGQMYIAVPFLFMIIIKNYSIPIFLLAIFIIIWVNDSFAYLSGSTFGKHKMFERISPKKSWEGFFGGLIGSFIAAYLLFKYLPEEIFYVNFYYNLNFWQWLIFALIIVIFGTLGDLFESLIKRTIGVKDSGNIMPGHGGFLDRLDSVLFVLIPICVYLEIIASYNHYLFNKNVISVHTISTFNF